MPKNKMIGECEFCGQKTAILETPLGKRCASCILNDIVLMSVNSYDEIPDEFLNDIEHWVKWVKEKKKQNGR